jgi:hypothetical protein
MDDPPRMAPPALTRGRRPVLLRGTKVLDICQSVDRESFDRLYGRSINRPQRGPIAAMYRIDPKLPTTGSLSRNSPKSKAATRSTRVPADLTVRQANHLAQTWEATRAKFPLMMARTPGSLYPLERNCAPT